MKIPAYAPRVLILVAGMTGLAFCKRTDADALARVASVAAGVIRDTLPSGSALTGPLAPLRPARLLPPEERVRARLDTDAPLAILGLDVQAGATPGQVRLRGVVSNASQRLRAEALAETTTGVTSVLNDIAIAE